MRQRRTCFAEALEVDPGPEVVAEARGRFLAPLLRHPDEPGPGHAAEIAGGDSPHTPTGCPFQAWSVGELLRLDRIVLGTSASRTRNRRPSRARSPPRRPGRR